MGVVVLGFVVVREIVLHFLKGVNECDFTVNLKLFSI